MKNSIFVDGIANIVLVDGVVRFDLVALSNSTQPGTKKDAAQLEVVASMATTMPGFLRLHEQMQGVIKKMLDQGLLKRTAPSEADAPAVAAPAPQTSQ